MPPLRRLDVLTMLTTDPPPVPWVVEPLLARGHLTMLTGREGQGKSLLSLGLAAGLARGETLAGFDITQAARVMVVDAENHPDEMHRRVRALGLDEGAAARLVMYDAAGLDLLDPAHLDALAAAARAEAPDVLVLDSMRSTWRGKENDSDAAGPHLDRLRARLARATNAAVLVLHHDGKAGGYRGSTAIGASVDLLFHLERVDEDPVPDRRRLRAGKFRLGSEPEPLWLRLHGEPRLGIVEVEAARPFVNGEDPGPDVGAGNVRAALADRIPALLADGVPRRRADVARALGRDPKDRTTGRALDALEAAGTIARDVTGMYRTRAGGGGTSPTGRSGS